jgi:serine/threonine protein phosphatase PrpC
VVKNYRVFSCTVPGVSHEKKNEVCQDDSGRYDDDTLKIVAVADGHGEANCFRSDQGAKIAVDCAIDAIKDFAGRYQVEADEQAREKAIGALVRHIAAMWQARVERHYSDTPFEHDKLAQCDEKHRKRFSEGREQHKAYGTTLIAAAIVRNRRFLGLSQKDYWFGFHIGDGRFTVLQADGTFAQPVPWDEQCFLNVTTSLCDLSANDRPRVYCDQSPPIALFLCSDGIDDNYPVEENERHLSHLYAKMAITLAEDGFDSACAQIEKLCGRFAREGKGDDTSLALIVDMERIREIAPELEAFLARETAPGDREKRTVKASEPPEPIEAKPFDHPAQSAAGVAEQTPPPGSGHATADKKLLDRVTLLLVVLVLSVSVLVFDRIFSDKPSFERRPASGEAIVSPVPSSKNEPPPESFPEDSRHPLTLESNSGDHGKRN